MLTVLLLAALATPPAAPDTKGFEYALAGDLLQISAPGGTQYQLALPCPGRALALDGGMLFLACGHAGLAVFSLKVPSTPELLSVRDLGGEVQSFHVAAGRTWVEVARSEARPLSETGAAPPARVVLPASDVQPAPPGKPEPDAAPEASAAPAAVPPTRPSRPEGKVTGETPRGVVVDMGEAHGLTSGQRVALLALESVELGTDVAVREHRVAVGVAGAVSPEHAEIELGVGERAPAGAIARPTTDEVTAQRYVRPRPVGIWEVSVSVRPFLAVGTLGAGTISDAAVGVRLEPALHLQAVVEPFGLGYARAGNVLASAVNLVAAYDTELFEIGLGAGWGAVNKSGLSIVQAARLGAVDGLRLSARNTFLLYDRRFHYGGTVAELLVPVGERSWAVARGGGGVTGFGYGELGLKWLARGRGLEDSLFLTVSLGYGGLAGEKRSTCQSFDEAGAPTTVECFESVSYSGPMVGLSAALRL